MTIDPAPTSTCPNVFLLGLPSIAYDHLHHPDEAHRSKGQARTHTKGVHRAKAHRREPYSWLGAGALTLGLGAALASASAIAHADGTHTGGAPSSSTSSAGTSSSGTASGTGSGSSGSSTGAETPIHKHAPPPATVSSSGGNLPTTTTTTGTSSAPSASSPTAPASQGSTASTASASTAHPQVAAEQGSRPNTATGSSAPTAPPPTSLVSTSGAAQPTSSVHTDAAPAATAPTAAHTALTTTTSPVASATVSTPAVTVTPSDPAPESPIATILALPGRIANVVLELFGIQEASGTTPTPISPAPLIQLALAAFREIEKIAGLDTPVAQPAVPSETFTGSLTTPTPTVAQLLDASEAADGLGTTPGGGLTPFTVKGVPVTHTNDLTGTYAQVWVTPQNQIVIAYQGTTGGTNVLFNPLIAVTQVVADVTGTLADIQGTGANPTPAIESDALSFAKQVEAEAAAQGYSPNNIFVTGHSLGATQAEYVAQQTGLAGIGFESPGLPTTVAGNGADSLFVNTATYGDWVAYFATDLPGEQPFAPAYVPGGGSVPHYGPIVLLGAPSSQYQLTDAAALWGTGPIGDLIFLATGLVEFLEYHWPGVQAYSLGVNPEPDVLPGVGDDSGPVYDFADLTIPEFLQSASADGILVEP
jgi:hypothetical protein